jgi:hypothetical protein
LRGILATGLHIREAKNKLAFKSLLDSGGTDPMINLGCIPLSVKLDVCASPKFLTTQGWFTLVHMVVLPDLCLPELSFLCHLKVVKALVFDVPNCPYNILLGCKFMEHTK